MQDTDTYSSKFTYSLFLEDISDELQNRRKLSEPQSALVSNWELTEMRERANSHITEAKRVERSTPSTLDEDFEMNEYRSSRNSFSLRCFALKNERFISNFRLTDFVNGLEDSTDRSTSISGERIRREFERNLIKKLSELFN